MMSKRKFISSIALLGLISSVSYAQHCTFTLDPNTSVICMLHAHKSSTILATTNLENTLNEKCILGLGKYDDDATPLSLVLCSNDKTINGKVVFYQGTPFKSMTVNLKGVTLEDKSSEGNWQVLNCTGKFSCDAI